MDHNHDQVGLLLFIVYAAIGIPIALLHIRQQQMSDSVKQSHHKVQTAVVGMLAIMWPVLLFSMALLYWQQKRQNASEKRDLANLSDPEGAKNLE